MDIFVIVLMAQLFTIVAKAVVLAWYDGNSTTCPECAHVFEVGE